jgi:hypothetical protein
MVHREPWRPNLLLRRVPGNDKVLAAQDTVVSTR